MALTIETGHFITSDVKRLESKRVRFVTESGRTMFEVSSGSDGRSIEVRSVEVTKHDGQVYSNLLSLQPSSADRVTIRTVEYYD